jgi:fatty acid desaturase
MSRSVRAILPPAEVNALCVASDAKGLVRLAAHLAVIAAGASLTWMALGTWLVAPTMLLQGLAQVSLFAPLHECVHRTAFRSRGLNDAVASAVGLIAVLPAHWYRRFHYAHHRFTQDPARDPELAQPKPETWPQWAAYVSGWHYWRLRSAALLRHARGVVTEPFIPPAERPAIVREARLHLAAYGLGALAVAAGSTAPLLWWLGPALLAQPFLRLYLLAEHTGCALGSEDVLTNTRTTFASPPVRFLMWNMPFHTEHHAFPAVPFHALPELHRRMAARLVHTERGYAPTIRRYVDAIRRGAGRAFVEGRLSG